jgi:hypothetical protein
MRPVDHQSERQPRDEPYPGISREVRNQREAYHNTGDGSPRVARDAEGSRQLRLPLAAKADIAAVRNAVVTVSSDSSSGYPVSTSASTPNAVTVRSPAEVFLGCPLTYLNEYSRPSLMGISSMTPRAE